MPMIDVYAVENAGALDRDEELVAEARAQLAEIAAGRA
ncbi:hypothetical protein ABIA39_003339 [Nocardia sp. GAS34]